MLSVQLEDELLLFGGQGVTVEGRVQLVMPPILVLQVMWVKPVQQVNLVIQVQQV